MKKFKQITKETIDKVDSLSKELGFQYKNDENYIEISGKGIDLYFEIFENLRFLKPVIGSRNDNSFIILFQERQEEQNV